VFTPGVEIAFADADVAEQKVGLRERLPLPERAMMLQGGFQMIARKFGLANRAVNAPEHQMACPQVFGILSLFGQRERLLEI